MLTRMIENMDTNAQGRVCARYSAGQEQLTSSIELLKSISSLVVTLPMEILSIEE